jgi:4-hydroxybenzoyl-CoA thioesterase
METFETRIPVRFQHTDPAGLVFYPRYFEMINQLVEDWFDQALEVSFKTLHEDWGQAIPTVHIEMDFNAPAHLGDILVFALRVARLGGSSLDLDVRAANGPDTCLKGRVTLVHVANEQMAARNWPPELRERMARYADD